jgi:hypothetical protein
MRPRGKRHWLRYSAPLNVDNAGPLLTIDILESALKKAGESC